MKDKNYIPYGDEWEKELMKLPKKYIIQLLREAKFNQVELNK